MAKVVIRPQSGGVVRVEGVNYTQELKRTQELERKGQYATACEARFDAVQNFLDTIEEESILLDWEDQNSRALLEMIYRSAADHLQIGEMEMAIALWECVTDMDEEDHFEANMMLAFCYVAIEDWDCLESARFDISPKMAEYHLLQLWECYVKSGGVDRDALRELRTRHKMWWEEFTAEEHVADEAYLQDCRSERPSKQTEAREFWFATAALWENNSEFLNTIKRS